ncbi:uncharacterized protein LOC143193140 [Rhynchophorus ferrugineus]|uniref:uncharacterized protein LOC143193140 n=1 Tax=Rhynchophorus ferrugineus TaxID=354439 RepID=UPI003FCCAC5F
MMLSVCKKLCLVFIIGDILAINSTCQAKCDFSKIFRTPKDMRHVNFDHLEIVERAEFNRFDTTTTPQPTTTTSESTGTKKGQQKDGNVANAQVLLRFGGDNIDGNNHVIKHLPHCQNLLGGSHLLPPAATTYNHNYFTPPCHHQYYHPYPPPVPFVFPNYYYSFYDELKPYIPQELNAYLNRFYQHGMMDYDGAKEMRAKLPCKRPNKNKRKLQNLNVQPKRNVIDVSNELEGNNLVKPRVPRSLKPSDDVVQNTTASHELKTTTPKATTDVPNDDTSNEKIVSDIKTLLNNALIEYRGNNSSDNHKMLISYPIFGEKSKPSTDKVLFFGSTSQNQDSDENLSDEQKTTECACLKHRNNDTKSKPEQKFVKDLEDLMHLSFNDTTLVKTLPFFQKYLSSMINILKSESSLSQGFSEKQDKLQEVNDLDSERSSYDVVGVNNLGQYMRRFYNDAAVVSPISKILYKQDIDRYNQARYFSPRLVAMVPIDSRNFDNNGAPYVFLPRGSIMPEYFPRYGVELQKRLIPSIYDIDSAFTYCARCGSQSNKGRHCNYCGYLSSR